MPLLACRFRGYTVADVQPCKDVLPHVAHQWTTRLAKVNGIPEDTLQYHHCPGKAGEATLEGATREPALGESVGSAGEFAAQWNAMEPERRERWVQSLRESSDTAVKCWQADHEGIAAELRAIEHSRAYARTQPMRDSIENLLADELYDGWLGPMGEQSFEEHRRALADKLAELVGERLSHEHTVNVLRTDWERMRISDQEQDEPLVKETQWYAYWTGVHQAVQHWADGSQMECPYPTPHDVVKKLVLHLLDNSDETKEEE